MMQGDSQSELESWEADAARFAANQDIRASDDACMRCREEYCPGAFGGFCPLEQEQDYREYKAQVYGAQSGTSRF